MYLTLNLLPPPKKKIILRMYLILYAKILLEAVFLYSLIVAIVLILANNFLKSNMSAFEEQTANMDKTFKAFNEQTADINSKLKLADFAQKNSILRTSQLSQIFELDYAGIALNGLDLNAAEKSATIQGMAKTRDDLLRYKNALAGLAFLEDVEAPLEVLSAKENIAFTIIALYKK